VGSHCILDWVAAALPEGVKAPFGTVTRHGTQHGSDLPRRADWATYQAKRTGVAADGVLGAWLRTREDGAWVRAARGTEPASPIDHGTVGSSSGTASPMRPQPVFAIPGSGVSAFKPMAPLTWRPPPRGG
jgi:hypothetical protein